MAISTVVFDCGGTLVRETGLYPEEGYSFLLSRTLAPHNLREKQLREFHEKVFQDMLQRREQSGLDFHLTQYLNLLQACLGIRLRGDPDEIAFQYWVRQYKPRLEDGATECLRRLREKNARIGLLSNTVFSRGTIELLLKKFGILDLFDAIVCSSEVAYRKPHSPIFEAVLGLLRATPAQAAMVGDNLQLDIAGAASMGMTTVWYNPCGVPGSAIQPHHIVSDLRSVPWVLGFR